MSTRVKYYEIFGLTATASKSEVKRAYRKLAMKFHPDRNPDPKAHKLFLDLTEAYHILMDDKPVAETLNLTQERNQKTEEQRIREAQERLRQQADRIKLQQDYFFRKMISGRRWKIFKVTVIFSTILALALLIEPILPSHFENHTVVSYSSTYNGLQNADIRYLKTEAGLNLFVANPDLDIFYENPQVVIERSFLLRNPVRLWYQTLFTRESFPVDFSIMNLYPLFPLFFLFPAFTYWYKRKTYNFVMLYYFSQYIVGIAAFYILFSQDRWAHLLTFGLL